VVEQYVPDGGAGFVEGLAVGQVVFRPEAFDAVHGLPPL
jgi:hypothetical protein